MQLNVWIGAGNLARDAELRYTAGGAAVCNFTVAVNRDWKNESGERQHDVCFVDATAWGKVAEFCAGLRKGAAVLVEGSLRQNTWTGKDGTERSKLVVVAQRVQGLVAKPAPESTPADDMEVGQ
jgi:single-strand DNA-binding protein